jgi:phage-related tail protein
MNRDYEVRIAGILDCLARLQYEAAQHIQTRLEAGRDYVAVAALARQMRRNARKRVRLEAALYKTIDNAVKAAYEKGIQDAKNDSP